MALKSTLKRGVNSHWYGYAAYNKENTDEVLRLAHELGSTIHRINVNPRTPEDVEWVRKVCRTCHDYGMEVVATLDYFPGTPDEVYERMAYAAKMLKDDADYFQIFNETDLWAAMVDGGGWYGGETRNLEEDRNSYNPARVEVAVAKMRAAFDAFHQQAPNAKLSINLAGFYTPMLDFYLEAGLKWDIIGIDTYDSVDFAKKMAKLEARYPDHDIMVMESNLYANNHPFYKDEDQVAKLEDFFRQLESYPGERLKAYIVYELLDQPEVQKTEKWNGEAHFGLVHVNPDNTIADPKPAYYTVQKWFKGE